MGAFCGSHRMDKVQSSQRKHPGGLAWALGRPCPSPAFHWVERGCADRISVWELGQSLNLQGQGPLPPRGPERAPLAVLHLAGAPSAPLANSRALGCLGVRRELPLDTLFTFA